MPHTPDRSYNREDYAWVEETWSASDYEGPGYAGFYLDLYRTIREGAPLAVTPEDIRRQVEVLEACHRQSQMPPGS